MLTSCEDDPGLDEVVTGASEGEIGTTVPLVAGLCEMVVCSGTVLTALPAGVPELTSPAMVASQNARYGPTADSVATELLIDRPTFLFSIQALQAFIVSLKAEPSLQRAGLLPSFRARMYAFWQVS